MTGDDAGPAEDPAAVAAANPEPNWEGPAPVHAVGIGPGNPDYLTRRAEQTIAGADAIVGFETVVGYVRDLTDADALACGYDDQTVTRTTLGELATHAGGNGPEETPFDDLSVLVVRAEHPLGAGRDDVTAPGDRTGARTGGGSGEGG